jgi:hypothetical protein
MDHLTQRVCHRPVLQYPFDVEIELPDGLDASSNCTCLVSSPDFGRVETFGPANSSPRLIIVTVV